MANDNIKKVVYSLIEEVAAAEKVTRVKLAELSRVMLQYVPDSNDIDAVNRLLGVLTPMNKRTAILFFSHFLPWEVEKTPDGAFSRFGKKMEGEKKITKRETAIADFLRAEENTIWTWAESNVEVDLKPIDFAANITRDIKKALEGDKKRNQDGINPLQVLDAVFAGGLTSTQFMDYAAILERRMEEAKILLNREEEKVPAE